MSEQTAAAGWYPVEDHERYWDGSAWTDQKRPLQATQDRDPDALWQAVGKPMKGFGAGKYKLTSHYLFFEKGALRTDAQQVPISSVLDVDLMQSMTQKARGVGTIRVQIQRATRVETVMLEDVAEFREGVQKINETAHAARAAIQRAANTHHYSGAMPGQVQQPVQQQSTPVPATAAPDFMAQLKQLGELRDAGVLTDEEFATKKADILSRM
ncbi:SHOCT domain-containing protein [Nocardioides sp. REDSEA-S30_B4]|jgi:hypothetical protein|uniref:SHOCT domain-containing protein n=1 Tax=Nocardioides sp. REDSEA-S30_B4 TaxID=1811552 RepID=UPI000A541797|nr:SHOCT domain-containing protein [Nocardioides sp. REDSEA-S30_B4]